MAVRKKELSPDVDLADKHGLTLCDHCWNPMEIHTGFNHSKGECLIDRSGIMMSVMLPSKAQVRRVTKRLNSYFEDLQKRLDAEEMLGAYI